MLYTNIFLHRIIFCCCATFLLMCAAESSAQFSTKIGINAYVAAQGGTNRALTSLTRTEFAFSPIPAFGVEGTYSLNIFDEGRFVFALGMQPYSTRAVSNDPFSGRPVDDFQINTYFNFVTAAAGMRFHRIIGLSAIGFLIRTGLPLKQRYETTVDVFEIQGEAKPSTGKLLSLILPESRAIPSVEALLDIIPVQWRIAEGQTLGISIQAGMVLGSLVQFIPPRTIPPNYNILGQDPLAGLRTFNVQPFSFNVGLHYSFDSIAQIAL